MDKQQSFIHQKVPQSLYRNTIEEDSGDREPLDITIKKAPLTKTEDKEALKNLIQDKVGDLITALILEEDHSHVNKDLIVSKICTQLGIE